MWISSAAAPSLPACYCSRTPLPQYATLLYSYLSVFNPSIGDNRPLQLVGCCSYAHQLSHLESSSPSFFTVAALLSCNALVLINVVALRRTRLVLGWVTVRGYTILVFNKGHPGLLSLAISLRGTMSTGGGLGHRWKRNGEFCVTVALYQDC